MIRLSYLELSRMFGIPSKNNFMIMVRDGGLHTWKKDQYNLQDWVGDISAKEFNTKMGLLPGEKLVEDKYWVWGGYDLIIETTRDNLRLIKAISRYDHDNLSTLKRLFTQKIKVKFMSLRQWNKIKCRVIRK